MSLTIRSGGFVTKDPDSIEAFTVNWSSRIAADAAIISSVFSITGPDGALTQSHATVSTPSTQVFLTGGTVSLLYVVTNEIVTNESPEQTLNASFRVRIQEQ